MSILDRIFEKRGIKDANELDAEERTQYENYKRVLSKNEITIEDLKEFLESQIKIIEMKWRDYSVKDKGDFIPYHTIYRALLDVIKNPQAEREALETYLIQLHKL